MVGQLLPNTNEMLQCILALQNLDLNTAMVLILLSEMTQLPVSFENFFFKFFLPWTIPANQNNSRVP
jgi:hypothetical protein